MQTITTLAEIQALPSLSLESLALLPEEPALYFVLLNGNQVGYIGMSTVSLRHRWKSHHRVVQLRAAGASALHYLTVDGNYPLAEAERAAIKTFGPPFNGKAVRIEPRAPGFTINVRMPDELYTRITMDAKIELRSVNQQLSYLLKVALDKLERTRRP